MNLKDNNSSQRLRYVTYDMRGRGLGDVPDRRFHARSPHLTHLQLDPVRPLPRSPTDNETRMFYEIVIAPGYTPEGLECLKGKSKNLRILEAKPRAPSGLSLRQVRGGGRWEAEADVRRRRRRM